MQRALDQMKVRLHPVISQWHGVSGLAVVDAILAGERDPAKLLAWCDASIRRAKAKDVLASLEGVWSEHHLFELAQARRAYQFCQEQIGRCDESITAALQSLKAQNKAPRQQRRRPRGADQGDAPQRAAGARALREPAHFPAAATTRSCCPG